MPFTIVFFVIFLYKCNSAEIRSILLNDLPTLVNNSCIVSLADNQIESNLNEFFVAFSKEFLVKDILLCKLSSSYYEDGSSLNIPTCTDNECKPTIILFAKRVADLSCLISPPTPKKIQPTSIYSSHLNFEELLAFINDGCNTDFEMSGQLNKRGQQKETLQKSLYLRNSNTRNLQSCPQINIDRLESSNIAKSVFESTPLVVVGGARHWEARQIWTINYLKSMAGKRMVHVKAAPNGIFEGSEKRSLWIDDKTFIIPAEIFEKLPFPELVIVRPGVANILLVDLLNLIQDKHLRKSNVSLYLEYSSLGSAFGSNLESQVPAPSEVMPLGLKHSSTNVWLSDGNTVGKLHFDPFDNILASIRGSKTLSLFHPLENTNLYEGHIQEAYLQFNLSNFKFTREGLQASTAMVMSPIDLDNVDYEKFALFRNAHSVTCTINEGDFLYLPAFWWHEVRSSPDKATHTWNLAVNYWFHPFYSKLFPCQLCPLKVNPLYNHLIL